MKSPSLPSKTVHLKALQGQIERITFANEENGYTVARVKVHGRQELVTVVGHLMAPLPGEILKMKGLWERHPRHGEQFKVIQFESVAPATVYGIKKYLGSGLIKGIGPVMAGRIVKEFGAETLEVIENRIDRLAEVPGIGKKRVRMIQKAWDAQKEIRQVMLFLQSHGISSGYAARIYKTYGDEAVQVVTENPYQLAADIFGIGFITADNIAAKLGFAKDSPVRIRAGVIYVLHQLADDGHVFYPYLPLVDKCRDLLQVSAEQVADAVAFIALERRIVIEDLNPDFENFRENHKAVYLTKYHVSETRLAARLKALSREVPGIRPPEKEKALAWVEQTLSIRLAANQREAVGLTLDQKVLVITGGPGTGKTTIINAVLRIFDRLKARVLLAAPTGRAAKRMSEATGHEAKTIHRLLEFSPQKGGFQRNTEKLLSCDVLIIDEASMIDTILMHHLLKAVPAWAYLVLVGDVNQLPSVGAGNVLKDIIASKCIATVTLNQIFRQAQGSQIITNAHRINQGFLPQTPYAAASRPAANTVAEDDGQLSDFYVIHREDPEQVVELILDLAMNRIPRRFRLDPVNDIQVLTPMHKGVAGAANLNSRLQAALNPAGHEIVRGTRVYRVNDKVMQIKNNYDKDIFNGDIGRIRQIRAEEQEVLIEFDGRKVIYDFADLDEIVLAYAISVHKSQGSEFPAVILPVLTQHYVLLQRNLIYTGVTRGKQLVVLIGTTKALAMAVKNNTPQRRYTYLKERLCQ